MGTERCAPHGLAVGPDGRCILCRREAPVSTALGAAGTDGASAGRTRPWPLLLIALVLAALAGYALVRPRNPESNALSTTRASLESDAPSQALATAERDVKRDRKSGAEPRELPVKDGPVPSRRTEDTERPPASSEPTAAARPKQPGAEELRLAMRAVRITMYTTQWCPHCTRARAWLQVNNLAYSERDIESSDSARRERDRLNPGRGIPTADIDGEVLTGFSEGRWSAAIARATQRRLEARAR
ncbi:MAG: glutaredoxin family protein [Myxococcales bacterium]|nr:glutaredoxin family protein [Myxococcales bacterium]